MAKQTQSVRIDESLLSWLSSQKNKSDVINRALREYRDHGSFERNTENAIKQILESIQSVDATAHEILERIKKGKQ